MKSDLANQLWQARMDGSLIDTSTVDLPSDETAAYDVQAAITELQGKPPVGFKVGATSKAAQNALGFAQPFIGPLLNRFSRKSGDQVPVAACHKPLLEAEVVVGLAQDLPPRSSAYTTDEVERAVGWISPGIEVCATRFDMELAGNGLLLIADSGINMDFVLGDPVSEWGDVDLSEHPATLSVNGEKVAEGHSGMSVFGHPFGVVGWLATHPSLSTRGLKAGDIVTTGTCTGMTPAKAGDEAQADFGALGQVTARFVSAEER